MVRCFVTVIVCSFTLSAFTTVPVLAANPLPKCTEKQQCCGAKASGGRCDGQCWPKNRPCP
jgi:hypothetical protein